MHTIQTGGTPSQLRSLQQLELERLFFAFYCVARCCDKDMMMMIQDREHETGAQQQKMEYICNTLRSCLTNLDFVLIAAEAERGTDREEWGGEQKLIYIIDREGPAGEFCGVSIVSTDLSSFFKISLYSNR